MSQDPYIVTTNAATDITETSAKLHGNVYFRATVDSYSAKWVNEDVDLEVTLTYNVNLMASVSAVGKSQFELDTGVGVVIPDTIAKNGDNKLVLTFNAYDELLIGEIKDLTYTQSITGADRLQCVNGEDVISPELVNVSIPEAGELLELSSLSTVGSVAAWMEWDVTNHVKDALHKGLSNVDLFLSMEVEGGTTYKWCQWSAREDSEASRPKLTIDATTLGAVKDIHLPLSEPTVNYGDSISIAVEARAASLTRTIVSFSLSGITSVTTATLSLCIKARATSAIGLGVLVRKLTRADYVEMESTWNIYKTGNNWTTAGGDFTDEGRG